MFEEHVARFDTSHLKCVSILLECCFDPHHPVSHDPFVVPIDAHGISSLAVSRACIQVNPICQLCHIVSTCASIATCASSPSSPNDLSDAHSFKSFVVVGRYHWIKDSIPPWSEKPYLNLLPLNRLVVAAAVLELRRDL